MAGSKYKRAWYQKANGEYALVRIPRQAYPSITSLHRLLYKVGACQPIHVKDIVKSNAWGNRRNKLGHLFKGRKR